MAVQQVAGEVQLLAHQQEAGPGILVAHDLDDLLCRHAAVLDQRRAALPGAEGVDPVDLLVPKDQEHRPVEVGAGEAVPQVAVDAAVQSDFVPVLPIVAVGAADHAVIGHGLGIIDGVFQLRLDLHQGELGGVVRLLPGGALIALLQQGAERNDQQQDRRKPAQDDDRRQARP